MVIACDTSFLFSLYGNQKKLAEAEGLAVPV